MEVIDVIRPKNAFFLVKLKHSLPSVTVGQLSSDRFPTGYQQSARGKKWTKQPESYDQRTITQKADS